MENIPIDTIEDLKHFAERLANEIDPPAVFFLTGEMGAGKTTFVRFFAHAYGVEMPVRSPSFIIHHEYDGIGGEKIHHLDLYRLNNLSELHELKVTDSLTEQSFIFIEWADKFESELKRMFAHSPHYLLEFSVSEDNRKISFKKL